MDTKHIKKFDKTKCSTSQNIGVNAPHGLCHICDVWPHVIANLNADNSGWFRNTELCSDLKTFLLHDRIAKLGKVYKGLLRRDTDDHFSFFECRRSASANANIRNPHVFEGKYINVTQRMNDGHIRFNFKDVDFGGRFNPLSFAIGVMKEILKAFKCLGEEVIKTAKRVD